MFDVKTTRLFDQDDIAARLEERLLSVIHASRDSLAVNQPGHVPVCRPFRPSVQPIANVTPSTSGAWDHA